MAIFVRLANAAVRVGLVLWAAWLLAACAGIASTADEGSCTGAQREGKILLCCNVGAVPGSAGAQWRCAWVKKLLDG